MQTYTYHPLAWGVSLQLRLQWIHIAVCVETGNHLKFHQYIGAAVYRKCVKFCHWLMCTKQLQFKTQLCIFIEICNTHIRFGDRQCTHTFCHKWEQLFWSLQACQMHALIISNGSTMRFDAIWLHASVIMKPWVVTNYCDAVMTRYINNQLSSYS